MSFIPHNQAGRAQGSLMDTRYLDAGSQRIVPRQTSEFRPVAERTLTFAKPPAWTESAKCIGDAEFGKQKDKRYDLDYMKPEQAQALCAGCPIIEQCLAAAMEREGDVVARNRYGIWGGTTPKMRALIAAAEKGCGRDHQCEMVEVIHTNGRPYRRCKVRARENSKRAYWAEREQMRDFEEERSA